MARVASISLHVRLRERRSLVDEPFVLRPIFRNSPIHAGRSFPRVRAPARPVAGGGSGATMKDTQ